MRPLVRPRCLPMSLLLVRFYFFGVGIVSAWCALAWAELSVEPSSATDEHEKDEQRPQESGEKRPNIILLITDDQDILLGGADHMPRLHETLAGRGATFRNAFVHTPICCPSRSSILSGRYLHNGGARNNSVSGNCNGPEWVGGAERDSFAVHARAAGYVTAYSGKYLNAYGLVGSPGCTSADDVGCNRVPPGYDRWFGLVGNSRYYDYAIVQSDDGGETSFRTHHDTSYARDYLPDLLANRTLALINEFTSRPSNEANASNEDDSSKPFLIVNAWPTPHAPFTPAPWANGTFSDLRAERTPNWNASWSHQNTKHWLMRQFPPIDVDTEKWIDETYRLRLEALRSVDRHIGIFVDLLEERGVLDDTVIVYTSDNGFQLGQHRIRGDKRQLYEHDIRVPFYAMGPGIPENVTVDDIVLNVDIAPTIAHIATGSIDPPEKMDGSSFLPMLDERSRPTRSGAVSSGGGMDGGGFDCRGRAGREDFLITYHGEGFPPTNLFPCNYMCDSTNNTYHCVRSIAPQRHIGCSGSGRGDVAVALDDDGAITEEGVSEDHSDHDDDYSSNFIYCRFEDSERFGEYYDLTSDPWQLDNGFASLSDATRDCLEARLAQLRSCSGASCRSRIRRDARGIEDQMPILSSAQL